ncbi:MAG: NAD+ synthase [Phycisphaerales bacterium]
MKVALVPLNPTVGDIAGNEAEARGAIRQAHDGGRAGTDGEPDLFILPELAISGYPPKDLLHQAGFLRACEAAADRLGREVTGESAGTLVIGVPLSCEPAPGRRGGISNSLLAYQGGARLARYDKRLLPTYDVFDEDRYFVAGDQPAVIPVAGVRVGLSICEDLWRGEDVGFASRYADRTDPVQALVDAGAELIVNPSASPFVLGKGHRHHDLLRMHALRHRVPILAVNQLGGNDELVFDGHAVAIGATGQVIGATAGFDAAPLVVTVPGAPVLARDPYLQTPDDEMLYRVLVLGVRDYMRKTGFSSAVLGLSGGIDSAVTAVIAAAAIGPANVLGVALPSRYSSQGSKDDAGVLAHNLGIRYDVISIESAFASMLDTLRDAFTGTAPGVAEENLQSRLRGTILMALSNKFGHLLLTTGNKSELAVGYCTLYGDMNGGLAVLSDVTKHWVYRLAHWINANPARLGIDATGRLTGPIPESSITKPPSAELRPNQTDQDSLPPYPVLDQIIERYVERRQGAQTIATEADIDAATVRKMIRLIDLSEYKRKQAAIGLKVTSVAFGSGRRFPIAQRWRG